MQCLGSALSPTMIGGLYIIYIDISLLTPMKFDLAVLHQSLGPLTLLLRWATIVALGFQSRGCGGPRSWLIRVGVKKT